MVCYLISEGTDRKEIVLQQGNWKEFKESTIYLQVQGNEQGLWGTK